MVSNHDVSTTAAVVPPDREEEALLDLISAFAADNTLMDELVQEMRNRTYELSSMPPSSAISLAGDPTIGTIDLLGQAHSRPDIDSTLTEINVGLAQARLYTQLTSGGYKHVFVEGKATDLLENDPALQMLREDLGGRFAALFPEGVGPNLSVEQAQLFYEHGAGTVYAATRTDVSLHRICSPEENAVLFLALEQGLVPSEIRNKLTMEVREGLAMREMLHHFRQPGNEGTTVAWTMGALHSGAESPEMHRACGTTTTDELPVVHRHIALEDMLRPLVQTVHTESASVTEADDTVRAIWNAKAIDWLTFEELTSVEQQVVGLLRLEVRKQDFPTPEDLRNYLMEERLCPALVLGRCESVPAASFGLSANPLPPRISAGDEYQQEAYVRQQRASVPPPNLSTIEKLFTHKVQLADPVAALIAVLYSEKAGPFGIYRDPSNS